MTRDQIFLSAIRDRDGTVNVGYLVLFRLLQMLAAVLLVICGLAAIAMWRTPEKSVELLTAIGPTIGYAGGGLFGTALAACGVFLWGDSRAGSQSTITTKTETLSVPTAQAPVTITGVTGPAPDALLNAARGVEPMPAKIGPEDVGKRAALVQRVKPKRRKHGSKAKTSR